MNIVYKSVQTVNKIVKYANIISLLASNIAFNVRITFIYITTYAYLHIFAILNNTLIITKPPALTVH